MSKHDDSDIVIIQHTERILASSLSLLIVYSYLRFPLLRCNGYRLVCFLALSDLMLNFQFFLFDLLPKYDGDDPECYTQAFVKTFFINAGVFWTLLISLSMYSIIADMEVKQQLLRKFVMNHPLHHICVWGYSAICASIPLFFHGAYGYSGGGGCGFIFSSDRSKYFSIAFQWLNIWTVIFLTCLICCVLRGKLQAVIAVDDEVRKQLSRSVSGGENEKRSPQAQRIIELHHQLKWYPIILLIGWSLTTSIRLYQMITDTDFDDMPEWIEDTFTLTTGPTLQAVLNAIAYGFTPLVRTLWREMLSEIYTSGNLLILFKFGSNGSLFSSSQSKRTLSENDEDDEIDKLVTSENYGTESLKDSIIRESEGNSSSAAVEMYSNNNHSDGGGLGRKSYPSLNPARASALGNAV